MSRCFVIQPFDKDVFDKRYDDIIVPAIEAAGLEPYRVDRDPSVTIPMDDIERGIKESIACVAEITTNNPNVWYELGYAIASRKPLILICSEDRNESYPFDVHHRHIINYKTGSTSDYNELKFEIERRLKAQLKKRNKIANLSVDSPLAETEGLEHHEIVALVSVAEELDSQDDSVSISTIRQNMEDAGFAKIACTLALAKLTNQNFLNCDTGHDVDNFGNEYQFVSYSVTKDGLNWLLSNKDKLSLNKKNSDSSSNINEDDDLPF